MQTMPSKKRSTTLVTGVALLVMVVGLIAYGVNQRARNEVGDVDPMIEVAAPENGNATQPGAKIDAAGPTPERGMTEAASPASAPTTETPSLDTSAGMQVDGETEATPALTTVLAVPQTHVVQPNETLYSISKMYYMTDIFAGDIEELNGLANPNMIIAGMELKLPRPEALMTSVGQ